SGINHECLPQQGADSIAVAVDTHHRTGQTREKWRTAGKDTKTLFELGLGVLNLVGTQKGETVAQPCPRILRLDPDGVLVKRQSVLPNVIVADTEQRRDAHDSGCYKPAEALIANRRPCHSGKQCESES